jgi:hypothetical protein
VYLLDEQFSHKVHFKNIEVFDSDQDVLLRSDLFVKSPSYRKYQLGNDPSNRNKGRQLSEFPSWKTENGT